jgi:hypothetical protein
VEVETPMWSHAALAWLAAAALGVPFVACWTGRWPSFATGHTGYAWNTLFPGTALGFAMAGVTFLTGWAWPVLVAGIASLAGLVLLVATAFVEIRWLTPAWLQEQRREHRDPDPRRGVRW